jgi:hypothetical protein
LQPEQDLTNINFKSEKKQPTFKPTAKLRNVGATLQEEVLFLQISMKL